MLLTKNILHFALLVHVYINNCDTQNTVEIVRQIIQDFVKNSYCIIYSVRDDKMSLVAELALSLSDSHTYYLTNGQITNLNCNRFIIFSENITDLPNAFAKHIQEGNQLLNQKILVLYHDTINDKDMLLNLYPNGTQVIFVEIMGEDTANIWKKTSNTSEQVKLTFGLTGKEYILKSANNFNLKKFQPKSWRPQMQRRFKASVFKHAPFVVFHQELNTFTGTEYKILKDITQDWALAIRYIRELYSEKSYSYDDKVINDVSNGISDVAFSSLWQTSYLRTNFSLTYPHTQVCVTFIVPKPKLLSEASYVFQPFHLTLWLLIIIVLVITCYCLRFLEYVQHTNGLNVTFSDSVISILYGFRVLTQGGINRNIPTALIHLRMLFVSFAFTCLCLATAYSAGFTSSLTNPRYLSPIWTIKDMIKQNIKISFRVDNELKIVKSLLESSAIPEVRSLVNHFASDDSDPYLTARTVQVAGNRYITGIDDIEDYFKTHYQVLRECIRQENIVFVLQPNSPFTSFFNKHIQRLVEHGFVDHYFKEAIIQSNISYMSNFYTVYIENYYSRPLNIKKLQGAFYLLGAGLFLGFIAFIIEIMNQ